jgi:hypothetical protein
MGLFMKKTLLLLSLASLIAVPALAVDKPAQFIWEPVANVNSANIARLDWDLISTDAANWPDGRMALISYWRDKKQKVMMRCVDFKNKDFQDIGTLCSQPAVLNK